MMHDLCIYRSSRWNTHRYRMWYTHQESAAQAWTCTYVSTSTMITQNITFVLKHATHGVPVLRTYVQVKTYASEHEAEMKAKDQRSWERKFKDIYNA